MRPSPKTLTDSAYKGCGLIIWPQKRLSGIPKGSPEIRAKHKRPLNLYILLRNCYIMNGYKMTRKEFEKPVSYEARYRINNVVQSFGVNEYGEKVEWCDDYDIYTRSEALKILRQFIWTQHKHFGTTYDIDDFSVDSIGWYKEA